MADIKDQLIKDSYNYVLQSDLSTGVVYRIGGDVPVSPIFQSGLTINGDFNYFNGTEQPGYVLTTDGTGYAYWGVVSGSTSGEYLPLSGGTVYGNTTFTSGLTVNYVDFDTTPNVPSPTGGTLYFDATENALSYKPITPSNDVTVNLGQESLIRIYNDLGFQINNGQALHITGSTSGSPSVSLAIGTGGDEVQFQISGIATHDIPNSSFGFMTYFGIVKDINLTGFTVGEQIYLSQTVLGGFSSYSGLSFTGRICEIGHILDNSVLGKIQVSILNEIEGTIITTQENNILAANNSSTGVFQFSGLSITTPSGTTFNVGAVEGWIIDNTTSPTNPTIRLIIYSGATGITATNVTSATETYILLTSGLTITQQTTFPTPQQRRQNLYLGKFGHANKQYLINAFNEPDSSLSPVSQLRDMFTPIKLINEGVSPSANGVNLNINTSAGVLYGLGLGYITNKLTPNSLSISGTSPCTFQYRTQTGGTASNTTLITPGVYDNNGVVTAVGGGSNSSTNQRIYLVQNGQFRIQYGQQVYGSLAEAIETSQNETFTTFSNFRDNAVLIGILSVNKNATNLSDTTQARFLLTSKFGETVGAAGGISTTNLQQAYNNSSTPEIVTNSAEGALSIKNGTGNADNVTNLFEGQNTAGNITSFIRADGAFSGTSISAKTATARIITGGSGSTNSGTYSFIGGGVGNTASGAYSFVGGGNLNTSSGNYSFVGGGYGNSSSGVYSFIGGGNCNTASGSTATISGGQQNTASGDKSTVSGGYFNTSSGYRSTVSGGYCNTASGSTSTVSGGYYNTASGCTSTVSGGYCNIAGGLGSFIGGGTGNTASGAFSFISGGLRNISIGTHSFIAAGSGNTVSGNFSAAIGCGLNATANCTLYTNNIITGGLSATTISATTYFNLPSSSATFTGGTVSGATDFLNGLTANTFSATTATIRKITGGSGNTNSGTYSFIGGGRSNCAPSNCGVVGGGLDNRALNIFTTVGGGKSNYTTASYSFIGGGESNLSSGVYSTVSGGRINSASNCYSTVSGGGFNLSDSEFSTISGGYKNTNSSSYFCPNRYSVIAGGLCNTTASAYYGNGFNSIGGGECNITTGDYNSIGGGFKNTSSGQYGSTVGGGLCNTASGIGSTIGGGQRHTASGSYSTIGGGFCNITSNSNSTVSGGFCNTVTGSTSSIIGGARNVAGGGCSFIGGGICNRTTGTHSFIGAGSGNTVTGNFSAVIGCGLNATAACTLYTNNIITGGLTATTGNVVTKISSGIDSTGNTTTGSYQLVQSVLIPANTITTGDVVLFKARYRKVGANAAANYRITVNTTLNLTGAQIVAQFNSGLTILYTDLSRTAAVKGGTTEVFNTSVTNVQNDVNTSTSAVTTLTIDWTVNQFVMYSILNSSALDTTFVSYYSISEI